jgi:preprotein translocase subunit SecE
MAETKNPDAPVVAPGTTRFGEGPEGKAARHERGHGNAPGIFGRLVQSGHDLAQFVHDVRAEMKRVSWPTMTQVQHTTIITVIAVIFFAVYLFVVDQGLSRLILGLEWLVDKLARWLGLA